MRNGRRSLCCLARGDNWYQLQADEQAKRQQAQQVRFAQQQLDGEFNLFDAVTSD